MRFIILLILIILSGLAYYIMDSKPIGLAPEAVHVTQKVIPVGNGSVPKHRAMLKQARLIETRAHIVENAPTQGGQSGVAEWTDLGPEWESEMRQSLIFLDAQNGEAIYKAYRKEMKDHQEHLNGNLGESINQLSSMNGESGWLVDEKVISVEEYKRLHSQKVKEILGEHYDYILDQREAFKEKH
jgi:hypothetical protein